MAFIHPIFIRTAFQLSHIYYLLIFSLLLSLATFSSVAADCEGVPVSSTPLVTFLQSVQTEALKSFGPKSFDPKLYVDLSLKQDLGSTKAAFENLPLRNGIVVAQSLKGFLRSYFGNAGNDTQYLEPVDFVTEPEGFLQMVDNPIVRTWALQVHSLWKNLSRKVADDVKKHPERHSLLPLPSPMIIPGSRFREVYYWDSYWVIRGLLVSRMYDSAKAIVNNLVWLIDTYGHVFNGARAYYSNRSQPPLLSSMVFDIYNKTGDLAFVQKSLPSLLKEYSFWTSEIHRVKIRDLQGHEHSLSRYYAMWNSPRPESATIDKESASKLVNVIEKENFYRQVSSTAESGWDFSSRWMSNSSDITTLSTTAIIPVDLNTYLYKVELDIAFLAKQLGDAQTSKRFLEASNARELAMRSIFWNAEMNQWLDYWLMTNKHGCEHVHHFEPRNQNKNIFASNFVPLWTWRHSSDEDSTMLERVLKSFQSSGLLHEAGIATSISNTGQQWDFPNGWAPLQHMIVEGLSKSGSEAASTLAESIAVRWIRANYAAYNTTGAMHEKYNVERCGKIGGGGEYNPQTGFGWTNGVLLTFLEEYGWPLDKDIECQY